MSKQVNEQGEQIIKISWKNIPNYRTTFFVVSSMKAGWGEAFIEGYDERHHPFGLPAELLPPKEFQAQYYPALSSDDEFYQKNFEFDPKTYLHFDGWHGSEKNKKLPEITREGIRRFMSLSEREGAKTIISPTGSLEKYYCSDNLL